MSRIGQLILIPPSLCRYIKQTEGMRGLYKGLGPNIVGVAPSRAIYFWAYSSAKRQVNASLPKRNRDTPLVHVMSAAMAGKSIAGSEFMLINTYIYWLADLASLISIHLSIRLYRLDADQSHLAGEDATPVGPEVRRPNAHCAPVHQKHRFGIRE